MYFSWFCYLVWNLLSFGSPGVDRTSIKQENSVESYEKFKGLTRSVWWRGRGGGSENTHLSKPLIYFQCSMVFILNFTNQANVIIIFRHILDLINKDKQMEALVSKLCIRFRVSVTSRQWCDLAFCLSIINYNDKALKHLIDNIPHLVEKLHNSQVYAYFKHIGTAMGKSTKPDIKVSSKLTNRGFLHRC